MVINMRTGQRFDVRIDRATHWGNPYRLPPGPSKAADPARHRRLVLDRYRRHLWRRIQQGEVSVAELAALHGKRLGCWCKPLGCHGDVLEAAAEWAHRVQAGEGG